MTGARTWQPLMLPLVPVYRLGLGLREMRLLRGWEPIRRLRYPVISIGNLSTGGSGKTPFAIALARMLTARGFHVDVLSRGYRRVSKLPARVLMDGTAEEFGDEPLLIAREAGVPVYVAPQRYEAGLMAEANFAHQRQDSSSEPVPAVHILDDGFQHRQLARDVDIVLLNRDDLRSRLLPAGILREPLDALRRANCVAIPADQPELGSDLRARGWTGNVWRFHRRMEVPQIDGPVAAFCGIARPEQFFAGLEAAGLTIVSHTPFPDHHRYTPRDVQSLFTKAHAAGARALITTEKDEVRLVKTASQFPGRLPLKTAHLRIEIDGEAEAFDWLSERLVSGSVAASL